MSNFSKIAPESAYASAFAGSSGTVNSIISTQTEDYIWATRREMRELTQSTLKDISYLAKVAGFELNNAVGFSESSGFQ